MNIIRLITNYRWWIWSECWVKIQRFEKLLR